MSQAKRLGPGLGQIVQAHESPFQAQPGLALIGSSGAELAAVACARTDRFKLAWRGRRGSLQPQVLHLRETAVVCTWTPLDGGRSANKGGGRGGGGDGERTAAG